MSFVDKYDEKLVEKLAREMCKADGHNPEDHGFAGTPIQTNFGYMIPNAYIRPAWNFYTQYARVALDELKPNE